MILCSRRVTKAHATVVLFGNLFAPATQASACSCAHYDETPKEQIARHLDGSAPHSVTIFLGKVVSSPKDYGPNKITFDVQRWWDSPVDTTVQVVTDDNQVGCGYRFAEGQTYLVFAYHAREGGWGTSACTPTTHDPEPYLKHLGAGQKPTITPKSFDPLPYNRIGFALLMILMGRAYYLTLRGTRHKDISLPPAF